MIKKVITAVILSVTSDPDWTLIVVLVYEPGISYLSVSLFNMRLKKSWFKVPSDCFKVSFDVPMFQNVCW